MEGADSMPTPNPSCNCGMCRTCKQRFYRWRNNLKNKRTTLRSAPYVRDLTIRGHYLIRATKERVESGEILPVSYAVEILDRDFPHLKGVDLH
jgi:hypothetical protein